MSPRGWLKPRDILLICITWSTTKSAKLRARISQTYLEGGGNPDMSGNTADWSASVRACGAWIPDVAEASGTLALARRQFVLPAHSKCPRASRSREHFHMLSI